MDQQRRLEWGIEPPPNVDTVWGARAIFERGQGFDTLPDRQQMIGNKAGREALGKWLVSTGMKALRRMIVSEDLDPKERRQIEFRQDGYVLVADPKGSYGYLYIGAWKE